MPECRKLAWFAALVWPAIVSLTFGGSACAGEVRAAVAANFTAAAREIGARFEAETAHTVRFSFGSTGQLYTQITQSAPFDVFLAADWARPQKAEAKGMTVPGTRFTYATGRIVLYSRDPSRISGAPALEAGDFGHIAIANPATAPYGAAAVGTMRALGVYESLAPKLVQGTNIAQTFQFVETGNAELGFVALSQVAGHSEGSRWIVPQTLHAPIAQDAVLLQSGAGNPAAAAFLLFLRGPEAGAIMERFGYGTGD